MKNIGLIAFFVIVVGGIYFYLNKTPQIVTSMPVVNEASTNQVFTIKSLNYSYDVKEIKVKKGSVVRINFTNTEGMHNFKINEYNISTRQLKAGESESVTFTASKTGNFEYYCSIGQHRANGMFGKLIVEE